MQTDGDGVQLCWQMASGLRASVGLELHVQLAVRSKLFSGAGCQYLRPTNQQLAALDAALPGALPQLNASAVRLSVVACRALHTRINTRSTFDRKHYFYADMPAGYQITQQRQPLGEDGVVDYWLYDNRPAFAQCNAEHKRLRIQRVQIEQDSAKNVNDIERARTLVDLNRAGAALIEIVTDPTVRSGAEALCVVRELHQRLTAARVTHGRMQEGQFRVDANVSVSSDPDRLGTRTEVKNVNSLRHVQEAIDYEIERQIELIERGEEVINETRGYDYRQGKTVSQRDKEVRQDYRFLPEPNLPVLDVSDYAAERVQLPASLYSTLHTLMHTHGLSAYRAHYIALDADVLAFYESCMAAAGCSTLAPLLADFIAVHVNAALSKCRPKRTWRRCGMRPSALAELCGLLADRRITEQTAVNLLRPLLDEYAERPLTLVADGGLWAIDDADEVAKLLEPVLDNNHKLVADLQSAVRVKKALGKLLRAADEATQHRVPAALMRAALADALQRRQVDPNILQQHL